MHIFDEWADTYQDAVSGQQIEYRSVFEHYEEILDAVADRVSGKTIEFGVGTGNLFEKLLNKQIDVIGIEPNERMLEIAKSRFPNTKMVDGDFLNFPKTENVHNIVSSYAFHHLTDDEKSQAFELYHHLLVDDGEVIFADTLFKDDTHHQRAIDDAKEKGFSNLAQDLMREYYTTLPKMEDIITKAGFQVSFKQLNDFVWLIHAKK